MNRIYFFTLIISFLLITLLYKIDDSWAQSSRDGWWEIQSVDTVKYSRDLAREKFKDKGFDMEIENQIRKIADIGATHVAIGTPYDEEFLPYLERWVSTARKYGLNVWFRGNRAGWEGWFGYPPITKEEHMKMTEQFIINNSELFIDGDIFDACPECENGALGDPRYNGDLSGYRQFLMQEYQGSKNAFRMIGKQVRLVYSMNGDVARLVMDVKTTDALGGVVTVDHYVKDPERLVKDIEILEEKTGGKILLGEIGVPIRDIHGDLSEEDQGRWVNQALSGFSKTDQLLGLNYWTNMGGESALWNESGEMMLVAKVIDGYYKPLVVDGKVVNEWGRPVKDAWVETDLRKVETDISGEFDLPRLFNQDLFKVGADGYQAAVVKIAEMPVNGTLVLVKNEYRWWEKVLKWIYGVIT